MLVSFKNSRDEELYQSLTMLSMRHGPRMAKKIIQRIGELVAACNAQQLPKNARFHEHKGNRKGLFSLDLVHPYRLIVLPTCDYNSWIEITSVQIYEVMDPH